MNKGQLKIKEVRTSLQKPKIQGGSPYTRYTTDVPLDKHEVQMRAFHLEAIHFGEINTLRYMKLLCLCSDQHLTSGHQLLFFV